MHITAKTAEWYGWLAGWGIIVLYGALFSLGWLAGVAQIELPMHYLDPITAIIANILALTFLFGIRGFALQKHDRDLVKTIHTLMILGVVDAVIFLPTSMPRLFDQSFITLMFIAMIPVLCIEGIVLMRLAEGFSKYTEELGSLGKRIVWWNKTAGWMLASVILVIVGIFVWCIGSFFLWRLLAVSTKGTLESKTVR